MKNLVKKSFILLSVILISFACKNNTSPSDPVDFSISYSELPQTAKNFVTTNFKDLAVSSVKQRYNAMADGTLYVLKLAGGYFVDFNKDGKWITTGTTGTSLPWSIFAENTILTKIGSYIKDSYPSTDVAAIQHRTDSKIQVDLMTSTQLIFDAEGNFLSKN